MPSGRRSATRANGRRWITATLTRSSSASSKRAGARPKRDKSNVAARSSASSAGSTGSDVPRRQPGEVASGSIPFAQVGDTERAEPLRQLAFAAGQESRMGKARRLGAEP
jgi:hypothetical protein